MAEGRQRRSIRLPGFDYTRPGAYFITLCTASCVCLFGQVSDGAVRLSEAGRMVERWWHELARKFQAVAADEFIVMPDHFHGIIVIVGADLRVGPTTGGHTGPPVPRSSLPEIIQWFKTMTTNEYIRAVKQNGWPPFPGKLWQRNYYEHVVRGAGDLNRIRAYIQSNPARWAQDRNYPFG